MKRVMVAPLWVRIFLQLRDGERGERKENVEMRDRLQKGVY